MLGGRVETVELREFLEAAGSECSPPSPHSMCVLPPRQRANKRLMSAQATIFIF